LLLYFSNRLVKKIFLTCAALFLAGRVVFAHEANMDNTQGLFGISPEYVHTLINPLPTYGVLIGIFLLSAGLLLRKTSTRNAGLIVILICTGVAWAVAHYGQHGYNHLYADLDTESKKWANVHMDRAESFIWAFYITAVLSVIALVLPKRHTIQPLPEPTRTTANGPTPQPQLKPIDPKTELSKPATLLAVVVLICAIISFALGTWISRAGGRIRHTEFREHPAPTTTESHEPHHD
jgi:hypothetical protein